MKKYILILFAILSGLQSCNKDFLKEDPKSSLTTANYYKTNDDLVAAVGGIALTYGFAWNQTGGLGITFGSDDITTWRGGNKINLSDFDTYQANSSNTNMAVWWQNFYLTIKSANALIANYSTASSATDVQKNNSAGTAYFYRAVCYFFLTRTWGSVPMPLDNLIVNQIPLSTPTDIYTQIISDLQKAETMLPNVWTGNANQNSIDILPTQGSAKALLANVYLTMAGYPLKQTDKYALAAAKAKEVIDNRSTWGYQLLTNYKDIWDYNFRFNHETVFGCYYNNQSAAVNVNWQNGNQMGPPNTAAGEEGGWDELFGEINFYNQFPAGPRKDATYQTVYYIGNNIANAVDYSKLAKKHPYFWKYRDDKSFDPITHTMSDWWGSATVPIIRYAEVLLTYAEAKAMSSTPDATAYDAINQVRTRAGLANLKTGLSQLQFRDSVIAERGWEFAGPEPAQRWFDLVRTETVSKAANNRSAQEEPLKAIPNDATHTFYWAPLPTVQ